MMRGDLCTLLCIVWSGHVLIHASAPAPAPAPAGAPAAGGPAPAPAPAGAPAAAAPASSPAVSAANAPITTDCPVPKLPNPFVVQDKWWQLVYTKEVLSVDGKQNFGKITAVPFSIPNRMKWHDPNGKLIASIKFEFLTIVNTQDHYDCHGTMIAKTQETMMSMMINHKGFTQYEAYRVGKNGTQTKMGQSQRVAMFGAELDIQDTKGQVAIKITKPFITFTNKWQIETLVHEPFFDDKMFLVLLAASQEKWPMFGLGSWCWLAVIGGLVLCCCCCVCGNVAYQRQRSGYSPIPDGPWSSGPS